MLKCTKEEKYEMNKLCKKLCKIIEDNDKVILYTDINYSSVYWIHNRDYDVELRVNILSGIFTISRVCFHNKRCGCMTKCYKAILDKSRCLGIKKIIVQSVLTEEMSNWCLKNGFIPNSYCIEVDGIITGDYIKDVL